jgi:multidrug resistance efflux pump
MNSPNPAHPASSLDGKTIPFPAKEQPRPSPKLERLVLIEGEIRKLPTRAAIAIHAVNEPRDLLGFGHASLIALSRKGKARMEAASSVSDVDAAAPLVRALCAVASANATTVKAEPIDLTVLTGEHLYPFRFGCWVPLLDKKGQPFAGLLYASAQPWSSGALQIANRLGETYAHAIRALSPPSLLSRIEIPRWLWLTAAATATLLAMVPVPLTVLAPFEVVAAEPGIVTAPLDGVIARIDAPPNAFVREGELLFHFDATERRADEQIARQKQLVASARVETARNGAFSDVEYKHGLAVAEKELELAAAEHGYAQSLLERVDVRAPTSGVLLYGTASDWIGKPVQVGEKVMEIADQDRIAYRIDLDVHNAVALEQGAPVRLFLDADPMNPQAATVSELSYHATPQPDGRLAFRILAMPEASSPPGRLGLRGTAQISGSDVSLGFFLFRRPIAAVRQFLGL